MEVDSDDKVMPNAGNTEGNSEGVVVPRNDGADYIKVKVRQGLAQLPVAPVDGPAEGTAEADALMEEVEDAKEEQADDDDDEDAGDDDLFGDEGEDEDEEEKKTAEREDTAGAATGEERDGDELSEAELERRRRLEYEEEDAPVLTEEKVEYAQVRLPKIPMASQTEKLHHAKLPNFLHLESAAFDPTTYNSEEEPKNLPVENIIRWRWRPEDSSNPSAPPKKQTNARVIRWNDGSMSLQLGGEIFDIATDRTATGKSVPPTSAPGMSSQAGSVDSSTYLVAQHGYVGLLETQALVTGNLTFRPTTIQSTSHRKIASSFAAQQQRKGKTVMIQAADDPEAAKAALEKKARAAKKPRAAKGEGSAAARKGGRRSMRSTNLADWSDNDVLTDEELDAAIDKSRAAERRARRDRERAEMEDFLASESDEDGEGAEDGDEDDDETERRRERRKDRDAEMDIADDLDEMEAQAEQVARAERSKKKKTKGSSAAAPQDIDSDDVDKSENEGFVRKKLVIESDEE